MATPIKHNDSSSWAQHSLLIDTPSSHLAGASLRFNRPGFLALPNRVNNALSTSAPVATNVNYTVGGRGISTGRLTPEVVSNTSFWNGMPNSKINSRSRNNTKSTGHFVQRSYSAIDAPPLYFGLSMPSKLSMGRSVIVSPGIFTPEKISFSQTDHCVMNGFTNEVVMANYPYEVGPEEIDFTIPDPSRQLEIRCCGNSIYVNPEFLQDVSPLFANFLVHECLTGKQKCVEINRDDINFNDIVLIARALCPCQLGMFPIPVDASTFVQLARLSWDLNIEKLKNLCDLYISMMALDDPDFTNDTMCDFLGAAYQYRLSRCTRIRLIECVVGREIKFLTLALNATKLLPEMVCAVVKAYQEGNLGHNNLANDVKLNIGCRTCRMPQPNVPLVAIRGELSNDGIPSFVQCGLCRTTICCGCILRPCEKQIDDFVTKFCKENQDRIQLYG